MPKERRKPAAGWASAVTPRSSASAPMTMTTPSSVPSARSRKKLKHRSSLEFLDSGDAGVASSSSSVGPPTTASDKNYSNKRKQKMALPSSTPSPPPPVAPASTAAMSQLLTQSPKKKQQQQQQHHQRRMSPQSKSKLTGLGQNIHHQSDPIEQFKQKQHGGNNSGGGKAKNKSLSAKTTMPNQPPSKKKTAKLLKLSRVNDSDSKNKVLSDSSKSSKEQATKMANHFSEELDHHHHHLTPKTNRSTKSNTDKNKKRGNNQHQKQSPEISSPLDRPQNVHTNNEIGNNATTNPMLLETYVEQWTKPSPDNNINRSEVRASSANDGHKSQEEKTDKSSSDAAGGGGGGGVDMHELDDPSSSVISTSSNSDDADDDDDGGGDYDGTIVKSNQQQLGHDGQHHQRHSLENNGMASLPMKMNEKCLETEYGKLAFLKQELEHKMQMHKLDAQKINPWMSRSPNNIGGGVVMGAYEINPWMRHSPNNKVGGEGIGHDKLLLEPWANSNDNSAHQSDLAREVAGAGDKPPSRDDVAYGKMAYQKMITDQRIAELAVGMRGEKEDNHDTGNQINQRSRRGGWIQRGASPHDGGSPRGEDYNKDSLNLKKDYFDQGNTSNDERPSSKPKPRKKRKRRVVETITRVIHEESEEEGSASTRGESHRDEHFDRQPTTAGHFSDSRRYHGVDDNDTRYSAKQFKARQRSDYGMKRSFSPDREAHAVPHMRDRDYTTHEQQSDGDSFQSEDGHDRQYSIENEKQARRRSPTNNKKSNSPVKKRRKRQGPNRGRSHTSQHSMLESLH